MLRNITIDNTNTTYFRYLPPQCEGQGWNDANDEAAFAFGQTYSYCSAHAGATAKFEFIGVAVYMMLPRFSQAENMWFQLDDRPFEMVDITSPTGSPLRTDVVWAAENLENTHHVVQMFPGVYQGDSGYVSVDAFKYTESDGSRAGASGSVANKTAIGIGVGLTMIIIALVGLISFFFIRDQKEKRQMAQMANKGFIEHPGLQDTDSTNVQSQSSGFRASHMISQSTDGAQSVGFVTQMPQFPGNSGPRQSTAVPGPAGVTPGTIYV